MRPHSSSTAAGSARTASRSRRSIGTIKARRPRASISSAVRSRLPGTTTVLRSWLTDVASDAPSPSFTVRALTTTSNPASASASAPARPMPRLAPVTTATGVSVMAGTSLLRHDALELLERIDARFAGDLDHHIAQFTVPAERRVVARSDRRTELVPAAQPGAGVVVAGGRELRHDTGADDVTVDEQLGVSALVVDLLVAESQRVLTGADDAIGVDDVERLAVEVVHVAEPTVSHLQRPTAEHTPDREQRALGHDAVVDPHRRGDLVRTVAHVDRDALGHRRAERHVAVVGPVEDLVRGRVEDGVEDAVVERQHVEARRLVPPQVDHARQSLRLFRREVVHLRRVDLDVVQLPDVVVEGRH